jgi:hypothetical protein
VDNFSLDEALRDGLRGLPVPDLTPEFDAHVLAALCVPPPWWLRLWEPAKPLLLGASCSLAVTLLALHWTMTAPIMAPLPTGPSALAAAPRSMPSLDALLDRPNLSAGCLADIWAAPPPAPPNPRPEPRRHAQRGRPVCWIV